MNDLIKENTKLIYSIIYKYKNFFDLDDLFQVGSIALLNAKKNYNKEENTKFSSYAYFYIIGEVNKYIRESNFMKVSKDLYRLNSKIEQAKNHLSQVLGKTPSLDEISSFLEIPKDTIIKAKESAMITVSLDKEDDIYLYNTYGYEEKSYTPEIMDLREEMSKLDSFSKKLINERYVLGNSQKTTSIDMGITQVMVSRREKEILTRLRTKLK